MTFLGGPSAAYHYPGQITSITDGDTVGATITLLAADLGFGVQAHQERHEGRWRLAGINAPELGTVAGSRSADHLVELLGDLGWVDHQWRHAGPPYVLKVPVACTIVTTKDRADNYGRILATIILLDDGTNVNERMVADGFAEVWPPRPG